MEARMMNDALGNRAAKSSLHLNSLERWIDEITSQEELSDNELIKTIKESFQRSMRANIEHHKFMMNNAKENGDMIKADRHRRMAEVYQSFLHKK